jgi:hypothetical protein
MKNFLNMSHYFPDGYRNDYTSCIDTPIAVSAGYYNYDNYFYYLFYHSVFHNWSDVSLSDWQALKGGIVQKLGLELIPIRIHSDSDLIPTIHEKLSLSIPVMMPAKYKCVFYFYLSGNPDSAHFILVSGFDSKRQLIQVRDANHLYESGICKFLNSDPTGLFTLFMFEDMLLDTWVKSNRFFAQEDGPQAKDFYCFDSFFHHMIYTLEKKGDSQINSFYELMKDFLENFDYRKNRFGAIVERYNQLSDNIRQNPTGFEIAFFRCFHVILGVIGKWLLVVQEDTKVNNLTAEFNELKSRYMDGKSKLVLGVIEDAKNNKHYPEDELIKIAARVRSMDEELFHFVANTMDLLK